MGDEIKEIVGEANRPADIQRASATETFRREASFDPAGISQEKRTCELSFSSECAVERGGYMEVLSHDPADCDLSRLNDSHPLLLNHDPDRQIGVIESASIRTDKKGAAKVRFSKSPLGDEIWRNVQDGIRRLVSVGYRRTKEVATEVRDKMEFVRFAWQPYEVSIVSVPADASVGIGRGAEINKPNLKEKTMENKIEVVVEAPDYRKAAAEILGISKNLRGKVEKIDDLANQAISEGKSVEQFRAMALEKLPEARPMTKPLLADVKDREWKNYSICRAINDQISGNSLSGFEREINDEIALKTGGRAQGFWLPQEAMVSARELAARSFVAATGTLGGQIVSTPVLGDEFIEVLRNRALILQMGARVLNLANPVTIPRLNAAGTANWVGETVAATLGVGNFTNLTLTPFATSAFQQYSKQLLATNNPSIDAIIRDDISNVLAIAVDLAALHGTGSGQPTGIIATSGIGSVLLATDGLAINNTTAYPAMVSLESLVAAANAEQGALGYIMRPAVRGQLKTTARFSSTNTPVYEDDMVNGYKAAVTNQVSKLLTTGTATTITSPVFYGNWNELFMANFNGGATDLVVDPYTLAVNGVVRIIARRWVDVGVRHAGSFAVLGGVLNG